jgi:hypothetical protein
VVKKNVGGWWSENDHYFSIKNKPLTVNLKTTTLFPIELLVVKKNVGSCWSGMIIVSSNKNHHQPPT